MLAAPERLTASLLRGLIGNSAPVLAALLICPARAASSALRLSWLPGRACHSSLKFEHTILQAILESEETHSALGDTSLEVHNLSTGLTYLISCRALESVHEDTHTLEDLQAVVSAS